MNADVLIEAIEKLEAACSCSIPQQYRIFLSNAGSVKPAGCVIDIPGMPGSPTDIDSLFSAYGVRDSDDVLWNYKTITQEYPDCPNVLPIGSDSGGGIFAIDLNMQGYGSILFIDLSASPVESYFVCSDFAAFQSKLEAGGDQRA
ncbi:SMI1/KNR4 family protein [Maricaulis parjimensis]|uniref:SMI1/KNR4 family protein n=1 Tax=Maricaulis parjimensis TaxID=144023 RepID=UPI00193955B8|nr:SMI1/KNR4 family protein [Maricaulis parjimensis]